ncbi:MAG: hypothetical protein VB049_02510 [Candidatus Pelethousia sp.]|nr:hypothetical protein [Candidatus Pelethousia sp.]
METKKYYAEDMPAAMEQIKRELGSDAIIIKSRKIKQKCGLLGLFRKSIYEVVVSCEPEEPPLRRREPAREPASPFPQRFSAPLPRAAANKPEERGAAQAVTPLVQPERFAQLLQKSGGGLVDLEEEDMLRILSADQVREQPAAVTPEAKLGAYAAIGSQRTCAKDSVPPAQPPMAVNADPSPSAASFTQASCTTEATPTAPVKRGRGRPRKHPPINAGSSSNGETQTAYPTSSELQTLARLEALERMMREIHEKLAEPTDAREGKNLSRAQNESGQASDLDTLLCRLEEQDVEKNALDALAAEARERLAQGASDYQALSDALEQMLGKPRYVRASKNKPRAIMLIGPTGVGKTTTLVKLVAACLFERAAKVGIINADVFRVGAQDQLGAYARILNVPMTTIYDSKEIVEALSAFSDLDFVFIDTSGKAPQDRSYQAELAKLVSLGDIQELYLTISSATSGRICRQIAKEYQDICPYRLLVTKLDESGSYGAVVNLCHASGQPLSYITTGQNVPEDIRRAKVDEIIASLLR